MRKVTALFVTLILVASAVPVLAHVPPNVDSAFNPFSDPAARQQALMIYDLEARARAGDTEARNKLNSMGQKLKDVFPNGSFVQGAWSNAARVAVEDWRSRKGENEPGLAQDKSGQLGVAQGQLVPYRNPTPAFSRNVLITRDEGIPIQNEPYLCVDPEDPKHLVAVSHNYGYNAAPAVVSNDGGETWTTARYVPISEQAIFSGDPVVSCARGEKAYYNFMSLGEVNYMLLNQAISIIRSDIAVSASSDGGMTWQQPSVVATNRLGLEKYPLKFPDGSVEDISVIAISFLDKPWMTLGPNPNDPRKDMLYASYTEFVTYFYVIQPLEGLYLLIFLQSTSEIKVRSSSDEGKTWQDTRLMRPVPAIADVVGTLQAGITELFWRTVQGSQLAVSGDGTVYAAWYDSTADGYSMGQARLYVTSSSNRGGTWSSPLVAAELVEIPRQGRSAPFRNPLLPAMAVGPKGDVYLVYPARTPSKMEDDADIYFVRGESRNGQLVFDSPVLINQDKTNGVQFFPAIAVAPNGTIHLMWGDTRDDPAGLKYNIYYTRSEDRGKTWGFEVPRGAREPDTRVTDFPSNPNKGFPRGAFIGDYFGIAATDKEVYMVWTDTRLGEYGPINSKIGFARSRAMPSPSVRLNPASGPAGKSIAIQGSEFQPDMVLFVQVGSDVAVCGRTSGSGAVECNAVIPFMAPDQAQKVILYDESGNQVVTSFFVEGNGIAASAIPGNVSGSTILIFVLVIGFAVFLVVLRHRTQGN